MEDRYNHREIDQKWQNFWEKNQTFQAKESLDKPKFYALDMFPYPSGAGLHVGHPEGYTASDIISRYKRMRGYEVLHPMGWDAFGLPAENYAIKTGTHPSIATQKNIENFTRQIKSIGFSYDWNREIDTTDPDYYKWTQWIFLKLFNSYFDGVAKPIQNEEQAEKRLAYEKEAPINFCPSCKTGLANEEVVDGKCDRCGTAVERKNLRQWILRITDYADRLLGDLDSPTALVLHGFGADSSSNFFPWVEKEMEKKGYIVSVPDFPNTENPIYSEWKKHFENFNIDEKSVIVAHSLGGGFILRYLSEENLRVDELILVAPAANDCGIDELSNFFDQPIDAKVLQKNVRKITILGSDNDNFIPLSNFEKLTKELNAEFKLLPNRGHLCEKTLPEILPLLNENAKNILDWPEKIKAMQRNWIGRSEGIEIEYPVEEDRGDFPQMDSDMNNIFMITWNTVSDDNEINDSKNEKFISGKKIINDTKKAKQILSSIKDIEQSHRDKFKIFEAVVVENHVHAVVWVSDEFDIARVAKNLKGVSSRNFFQVFDMGINSHINNGGSCVNGDNVQINHGDNVQNTGEDNSLNNGDNVQINHGDNSLNTGEGNSLNNENNSQINHGIHSMVTKENCNNLWRKGYHFAYINTQKDFERSIEYIHSHKKKSNVACFLSELQEKIVVYTTRPDTLFGATFLVISPEHPLVEKITTAEQKGEIDKYIQESQSKSDLDRTELNKDKTGVFTGAYAVNPANREKIPVWIADYILMSYGTGAIMAVPAHDERDFEFARKYGIEIKNVVRPIYTPIVIKDLDDIEDSSKESDKAYEEILAGNKVFTGEGKAINSSFLEGLKTEEAKEKMIKWLEKNGKGKRTTNYKLRDWIFSRQRYWGEPIPLVHCEKCGTVADENLPLVLPEVESYEPSGTGESPLVNITDWVNTKCPKCGGNGKRETNTMPQWAGSSWYWLRFMDAQNTGEFCSKEKEKYWGAVDLYVGGAEHAVLHLLYARFWHKVLFDLGYVSTREPFRTLKNQGMILAEDGQKMSKSLGNVVNPDEIIEKYGADTLRMYEMFMGPFEQAKAWSTSSTEGIYKFLQKIWRLYNEKELVDCGGSCGSDFKTLPNTLHKTIKKITHDIDDFKFNTAISQMMIFVNEAQKLPKLPKGAMTVFCKLISPFAPHLAEEIWSEILGNAEGISYETWPEYKEEMTIEEEVKIAVQINGKLRATFSASKDIGKEEALSSAKESVEKWLEDKEIVKEIFVPGKIVNLVIR